MNTNTDGVSAMSAELDDWYEQGMGYAYLEGTDPDGGDDWTTEDVARAFEAGAKLAEKCAKSKLERLRADLKAMEGFAELWYFVSDEAPLEFEKIVAEYSPGRWMTEAHKLLRAARR